jgi:hypothetical protein
LDIWSKNTILGLAELCIDGENNISGLPNMDELIMCHIKGYTDNDQFFYLL